MKAVNKATVGDHREVADALQKLQDAAGALHLIAMRHNRLVLAEWATDIARTSRNICHADQQMNKIYGDR